MPQVDDSEWLLEKCPQCGLPDTEKHHREATFAVPETYYMHCNECGHEWGHE